MNGFKKLIIENFQSHQRTEIDFSSGLNVFVGPSDSGKSAVLRALRWVLFNVPRGTDFIRSGARECRVSLTLMDGTEIVRVRSSSVNRYILRKPGEPELTFEGFGNSVPEEITQVHGIRPIPLDGKEVLLHFGGQLEPPFLLFESGSSKAKTIGRIIGAQLFDRAIKMASSDHRTATQKIRRLEEEKSEIEEKLKPYETLEQLEKTVARAEELFRDAREKQERMRRLVRLAEELSAVREEKRQTEARIRTFDALPTAVRILRDTEIRQEQLRRLTRLDENRKKTAQEIKVCRRWIVASSRLPQAFTLLTEARQASERWKDLCRQADQLQKIVVERETAQTVRDRFRCVPDALRAVSEVETMTPRLARMEKMRNEWLKWSGEKRRLVEETRKWSRVSEILPLLSGTELLHKRLKDLSALNEELTDTRKRIKDGREYLKQINRDMVHLLKRLEESLRSLGKCPTCMTPLEGSVIEHILEEYGGGIARAAVGREDQETQGTAGEGQ
ncbi:AAA family ATPase [Staphylospora marina]|uniref:AAA family ATPase n=1 Tax=Staphylospora marina TaxID=2490858 RepID=UPI000F5B99A6|nr:AAA family ATPase [Staphylospora marina]